MTRYIESALVEGKVRERMLGLKDTADLGLIFRIYVGLKYCDLKDAQKGPLDFGHLTHAHPVFYEGMAAMRILSERHGDETVLNYLGYRYPKNWFERLFKGDIIPLERLESRNRLPK